MAFGGVAILVISYVEIRYYNRFRNMIHYKGFR